MPVKIAAKIWINNSQMPMRISPNTPIPRIFHKKAGFALLQNPNNLSASSRVKSPFLYNSAVVRAPTGYPPRNPSANALPACPGRRYNAIIPDNIGAKIFPQSADANNPDTIRNGNKDGITDAAHNRKASDADCRTFTASYKNQNNKIPAPNKIKYLVFAFIFIIFKIFKNHHRRILCGATLKYTGKYIYNFNILI